MLSERHHDWLAPLMLTAAVALLFLGAPAGGAFDWSDAPRHALNGVFVKDFIAAAPLSSPAEFAYRYYAQYPALTILFYPPLFYFISAPFYALFGVSHATALFVVALHYAAFAWGAWRLFRFWLPPCAAGAAALMLAASPEIAFWGRQVMLEIPAFAFLVWSAVFFTRYRREGRPSLLYATAALLMLAIYTKLTAGFLALAYAGTLFAERRGALFRQRHLWLAAAAAGVGLIPLIMLTARFGQANIESVTGVADAVASRNTLSGWLWYLKKLPEQLGWALLASAVAAVGGLGLSRFFRRPVAPAALSSHDLLFWTLWAGCGYLFFSAIDLKEARHSIFILPPLVLAAARLPMRLPGRLPGIALAALAATVVCQTVLLRPVRHVDGYAQAVDYIAAHAPRDSTVLFSGYRDGSFVFNLRAREDRRDLAVMRADKLLLKVAVRRELGVTQKDLDENEIRERLNRLGVHYVVAQPGFWNDLAVMQRFELALASGQFEEVAHIATPANYDAHEKELVIYRNLGPVAERPKQWQLELPIIGRTIRVTQ